ncbi:hypothetical protein ACP4OV_000323 [Aristida adscensionis]
MASPGASVAAALLAFVLMFQTCLAGRRLTALVQEPAVTMKYHKGALLSGRISVNFVWYGNFSASQRAVVADFVSSLSAAGPQPEPSVATWFKTAQKYYAHSKARFPALRPGSHVLDQSYSLGKRLTERDLVGLAARGAPSRAINVVLTAADVAVDGFCMSRCGTHGASRRSRAGRFAYVWVGNPASQCPGQCAWPFHQPVYGPQAAPLVSPNGDVGVDGMVISLASMIVGTVTNPFGNGFYQEGAGDDAPLEAATACAGVYGKGAYPGYAGSLLVDQTTGASYNANGAHGRKYLVPALVDPDTSSCATLG